MQITRKLRTTFIISSSVISAVGFVMMLGYGLQSYRVQQYNRGSGTVTKTCGIGLFNFDNTSPWSRFNSSTTYSMLLEQARNMTDEEKEYTLKNAEYWVVWAENSDSGDADGKREQIANASNEYDLIYLMYNMGTAYALTILGMILLPIGLILLLLSILIKAQTKPVISQPVDPVTSK